MKKKFEFVHIFFYTGFFINFYFEKAAFILSLCHLTQHKLNV